MLYNDSICVSISIQTLSQISPPQPIIIGNSSFSSGERTRLQNMSPISSTTQRHRSSSINIAHFSTKESSKFKYIRRTFSSQQAHNLKRSDCLIMTTRLAFSFVAALASSCSINAFTAVPLSTNVGGLRRPTNPLRMARTSSRAEFDFNDEMPESLPRTQSDDNSGARRQRIRSEEKVKSKFVSGDDLHRLRHKVLAMRLDLQEARHNIDTDAVAELERTILKAQQVDAEFVYAVSMERMEVAEQGGRFHEAARLKAQAMEARSALPQFNLDGLWVGKYGEHGYEMVNVTYVGDTLVAQKVTGTKNVPKGEATFEVDLSPNAIAMDNDVLEPIELGEHASKQWGSKYLQRFAGKGQVAAEGYNDSQWIDGQLILVNDYFSFAWLPIGHQVFFGRPSAELILKLMKENAKNGFGEHSARTHLEKCWEETELLEDDIEVSDEPFNSMNQHDYYNSEGCFE
jgi:hypothetical protein